MRQHRETVWRVCWHYAHSDVDRCRDMVQEVWLSMWLRFDQLREDSSRQQQRRWVYRTTRSVLVDLYRRDRVDYEPLDQHDTRQWAASGSDYAEQIDDLMSHLADDERRLLQMRLDGYDAAEIAGMLQINPNAVYQRINRIIKKLRRYYGTED